MFFWSLYNLYFIFMLILSTFITSRSSGNNDRIYYCVTWLSVGYMNMCVWFVDGLWRGGCFVKFWHEYQVGSLFENEQTNASWFRYFQAPGFKYSISGVLSGVRWFSRAQFLTLVFHNLHYLYSKLKTKTNGVLRLHLGF